jgi:poly(A) polymerase
VKRWARAKGLYSNVLGLLGGVNCAILVAFVCQRYPRAGPATIVGRFFRIFDAWDWPNPVLINDPAPARSAASSWNPRLNPRDRAHLAPIVTPAHPTMNSSYNVGEPQLRAIRDELKAGVEAVYRVERAAAFAGEEPADARAATLRDHWRTLFGPSDFFEAHRHYVQVDVSAGDDDALRRWTAWCESRLRGLVLALDSPGFVRARPYAAPLERASAAPPADEGDISGERGECGVRVTRSFFVALNFEDKVKHIDLTPCVREFSQRVNAWDRRTEDMDLELRHTPRDALPLAALVTENHCRPLEADDDDLYLHHEADDDAPTVPPASCAKKARADSADAADDLYYDDAADADAPPPPPPSQDELRERRLRFYS